MASIHPHRSESCQPRKPAGGGLTNESAGKSAGARSRTRGRAQAAARALLDHPGLWQAGKLSATGPTLASEYRSLDQHLAGGFPGDGLTELMVDQAGIGELQLLVPAMRRLSQTQELSLIHI